MDWQAELTLGFRQVNGRTLLAHRQRRGPLTVQRPFYPEVDVCHLYLLHPPGGVVGGDQLTIQADLAKQAHALITTPGATKFYRSAAQQAVQNQHLTIADGARLEWFPQENIYFPGAEVRLQTRIELQGTARLALWEIHCLGRPTLSEAFNRGKIEAGLQLWRNGKPLLLERLRMEAERNAYVSLLQGQPVVATLLISHAGAEALAKARELLVKRGEKMSAATLLEDLLVVRYLGCSTERARKLFVDVWCALRPALMGKVVCMPRIWAT